MKFRVLLAGLLIVASATSAMAAGPYLGASGGITIVHDSDVDVDGIGSVDASYDLGGAFNVSGGFNLDDGRLEAEFGYKNADIDKISGPGGSVEVDDGDITIKSFMVNGYYDIKTQSEVTPFLGVGIGLLNGEIEGGGSSDDDTVFGYQLMAGLAFKVNPSVTFDVSYRFQGAAEDFEQEGVSISYHSSNVVAGVRVNF